MDASDQLAFDSFSGSTVELIIRNCRLLINKSYYTIQGFSYWAEKLNIICEWCWNYLFTQGRNCLMERTALQFNGIVRAYYSIFDFFYDVRANVLSESSPRVVEHAEVLVCRL